MWIKTKPYRGTGLSVLVNLANCEIVTPVSEDTLWVIVAGNSGSKKHDIARVESESEAQRIMECIADGIDRGITYMDLEAALNQESIRIPQAGTAKSEYNPYES